MSCEWDTRCITCNDTLYLDGTNHMDQELLVLCRHADLLAALADIEFRNRSLHVSFWPNSRIEVAWFRKHLGHEILPVDEYDRLYGQCTELLTCEGGHQHYCRLARGHEEPCRLKR